MERVYEDKSKCCGCTACASICPKQAISMVADEKGFLYPVISQESCVNCGLCKKVCAFNKRDDKTYVYDNPLCYAIKNKDKQVIEESRSGGIFTVLSDYVLDKKGAVYGAALGSDFIVRHVRAEEKEQRNAIRKSKYVQSNLGDSFLQIKKDIISGRIVMFSGTGCQCHGLKEYIKLANLDDTNLILCDLVCNGVPSPMLLQEYIRWVEEMNGEKLLNMEFRSKDKYGWETCVEKLYFNNKVIYQDYYANLYFDALNVRESCFNCPYTTIHRESDFTLGDYWGVKENYPDFYENTGVSLLLVHNEKAKEILMKILNKVEYQEVDCAKVLQPRLKTPEKKPTNYEVFWNDVKKYPYGKILKKYSYNTLSMSYKIEEGIKFAIRLPIRCTRKILKMLHLL